MKWAALALGALAAAGALVVAVPHERDPEQPGPVAPSSAAPGRFPEPPRALRTATVWAVGDGADGSAAARGLANLIARAKPTRFIYLGDVYPFGSADDFRDGYDSVYGRLRSITLPTPGNHDWPNHVKGYDRYWRRITGRRPPDFYSLRMAGWQLISLNSEEPLERGSAQLRWLARRVAPGGDCRIAFWHRPRFSAGMHGDQPDVDSLWQELRGRAALVLNGHDHDLQDLSPRRGPHELVVGAGGHGLYPIDRHNRLLAWGTDTSLGAVRLRLGPGRLRYDFISPAGRILRSGRATCER